MSSGWKPKTVVMGAGGMGALFGEILQTGGLDVTLVDNDEEHTRAIQTDGLRVVGFGGDRTVEMSATTNARKIDSTDIVLFQCKAHASHDAAEASKHLIDGGAVAISFQNGLGNEETIGAVVGTDKVLGGLTTMAALREGPGIVRDFSRVPSYIGEMNGELSERATEIAAAFTAAGLETHARANIRTEIWRKLVGNIAMSAASGATNLKLVRVLSIPELKDTCFRALDEALAVASSAGFELDRESTVKGLEMITAPGGTGDNKSSLCVDILNRRPTEVEFIYGSVIEIGDVNGVPTPTLKTLRSIVKGLENQYV